MDLLERAPARKMSLGAEVEGVFAGFLLARVYYGEFGAPEPVAVLDTMGVHPDFRGRGVGSDLIDQLRTNLLGLGIRTLQTEVSWRNQELLAFFQHEGFQPPRASVSIWICRAPGESERRPPAWR